MELYTLNDDFQPDKLVENYDSLIWTERYSVNGDFEIKSNEVETLINLLPKESYVTLRESTVPMVVEDHKIEKGPRKAPLATITGRSFETVLDRRAAVNQLPVASARTPWVIPADKASDAAYLAMRTVLGDFPRYQAGVEILPLLSPVLAPEDAIPQIDLVLPADYVHSLSYTNSFEIPAKNLYSSVLELLAVNNRGLKAVRPSTSSSQVGIEIYNGANLTGEGPGSDPNEVVVFDARFDQFDSSTYLLSNRGSTNVAYVYASGSEGSQVVLKNAGVNPSGLSRRVLLVDTGENLDDDAKESRGLIELYKYNATALFDGQIAEQVAAGYNTSYHLGDIIRLTGEYNLSQDVRVAEFIRTSDKSGTKAYPTFEAVS